MGNYIILDLIFCAVIIAAFFIGYRRGLLRTVWSISALLIAIALTAFLRPYATELFEHSALNSFINDNVYDAVYMNIPDNQEISGTESNSDILESMYFLPEKYSQSISENLSNAAELTADTVSGSIASVVTGIAATIFLFVVIRFALSLLYSVLKIVFSFPVLNQTNKLAGGLIQVVIAFAVIYTVLAAATVTGTDIFQNTVICRFFYENNLLLAAMGI